MLSSHLRPEERKDVHEIVVGAIEHKATFDTKWIGSGITGCHALNHSFVRIEIGTGLNAYQVRGFQGYHQVCPRARVPDLLYECPLKLVAWYKTLLKSFRDGPTPKSYFQNRGVVCRVRTFFLV